MKDKQPLLSICIPTYNRVETLRYSLDSVITASDKFIGRVEIIVSNNNSEDNTLLLLKEFSAKCSYLKYYSNPTNEGGNKNFFRLTDQYASGKYCWLLGDDDFLDNNAIEIVINILDRFQDLSFLGINFRLQTFDEYKESINIKEIQKLSFNDIDGIYTTYNRVICIASKMENIMTTFISASIFLREPFSMMSKKALSENTWDDFSVAFPHVYLQASLFKDKSAYYYQPAIFTACVHKKSWDDKNGLIFLRFMPSLYQYLLSLKYSKHTLKEGKNIINKSGLLFFVNSKASIADKIFFIKQMNFCSFLYLTKIVMSFIYKNIKDKLK